MPSDLNGDGRHRGGLHALAQDGGHARHRVRYRRRIHDCTDAISLMEPGEAYTVFPTELGACSRVLMALAWIAPRFDPQWVPLLRLTLLVRVSMRAVRDARRDAASASPRRIVSVSNSAMFRFALSLVDAGRSGGPCVSRGCRRRSRRGPFSPESPVPGSHDGLTGDVRPAVRAP